MNFRWVLIVFLILFSSCAGEIELPGQVADLFQSQDPVIRLDENDFVVVRPAALRPFNMLEGFWLVDADRKPLQQWGRICENDSALNIPIHRNDFSKLQIRMAKTDRYEWVELRTILYLNKRKIGGFELGDSLEWHSVEIPDGSLEKGLNRLQFKFKGQTKPGERKRADFPEKPFEFAMIDRICLGDARDWTLNHFAALNNLSLENESRMAAILTNSGSITVPLPNRAGGYLEFSTGYPELTGNTRTVQVIAEMPQGRQLLKSFKLRCGPGMEWDRIICDIPPGVEQLQIKSNGGVAVSEPLLHYRDEEAVPELPDVMLISVDTLRSDHMGMFGDHQTLTPFLDRFSTDCAAFANAYSQTTITNPSHASLLTGMYIREHGVHSNEMMLTNQAETLPEKMKAAGYRTIASAGARHMSAAKSGLGQGFEVYYGTEEAKRDGWEVIEDLVPELKQRDSRPLFVFLHIFDPHTTHEPSEFSDYYSPKDQDYPIGLFPMQDGFTPRRLRRMMASYRAEISDSDRIIETFLRQWTIHRGEHQLLVALVSDHGESIFEHGINFAHHNGLYEPHVRVPLLFYDSGNTWPRGFYTEMVETIHIAGTTLDRLKIPGLSTNSTRNLFDQISAGGHLAVHAEVGSCASAVWHEGKKLIGVFCKSNNFKENLLFDLDADPMELTNLRDTDTDSYTALMDRAETWRKLKHPKLIKQRRIMEAPDLDALRALGYLQ